MILQMQPWFGEEERQAMDEYLSNGGWITEFKKTREFEEQIEKYTGAKHAIAVNNGTISLTIAAMAVGIIPGDEVIVPNFTMIATPNSIRMLGAKPVFVDVEPGTLCLDFKLLKKAVTPRTKAIMLVSANGRYPKTEIEAYKDYCKNHDIYLIEDSAQSLGSFYPNGKHIGREGVVGSFSFSAPKVISTGQGGMLITDNDELADRIRRIKDFGRSGGGNDIHDTFGLNFKFTDIQAVIGIEQMKKLQWRVDRKKEILLQYQDNLKDLEQVKFFEQNLEHTTPWFIDVLVEDREKLQEFFETEWYR
jgi:perosamine synthetase